MKNPFSFRKNNQTAPAKPIDAQPSVSAEDPWSTFIQKFLTAAATPAGWSEASVNAAAENSALPEVPTLRQVTTAYFDWIDDKMVDRFGTHDNDLMRVRDKIALCLRIRFTSYNTHKQAVNALHSYLTTPSNASFALSRYATTMDRIWRTCGDDSVDFNYYSKRFLLAGVYASSLRYWLNDDEESHQATWSYIDQQIDRVLKIPQTIKGVKSFLWPS
jgi:ubiquinone biosynthesis protein COQ9